MLGECRKLRDNFLAPLFCWTKFPKKVVKFETKFPKFSPKVAPKFPPKFAPIFFVLCWQVEKSSPKISPDFSHRKFQISNRILNLIHQRFHKHTSAGLAAPTIFRRKRFLGFFSVSSAYRDMCFFWQQRCKCGKPIPQAQPNSVVWRSHTRDIPASSVNIPSTDFPLCKGLAMGPLDSQDPFKKMPLNQDSQIPMHLGHSTACRVTNVATLCIAMNEHGCNLQSLPHTTAEMSIDISSTNLGLMHVALFLLASACGCCKITRRPQTRCSVFRRRL